jgi:hypothetical protein
VPGGTGNPAFTKIRATFDDDMGQYVHDNTHDEMTRLFNGPSVSLTAARLRPVLRRGPLPDQAVAPRSDR